MVAMSIEKKLFVGARKIIKTIGSENSHGFLLMGWKVRVIHLHVTKFDRLQRLPSKFATLERKEKKRKEKKRKETFMFLVTSDCSVDARGARPTEIVD